MLSESVAAAGAYPAELECHVRLEDGSLAAIRPIRPDDAGSLTNFHEHLSGETVYRRFFNVHRHLQANEIERFTRVDYRKRLALVAEIDGRFSAVARYDRLSDSDQAEVAFVVADILQGHGLGSLMLEHLAAAARRRGVATFLAHTLGNNYPMQNVFRHAGFTCAQRWADGLIEVSFPIAPSQQYLEAILERELGSIRPRLARVPTTASGGLGVACQTAAMADVIRSACHSAGLDVARLVVADECNVDPVDALLWLAVDNDCQLVVVESAQPAQPRRFVALAREAVRHRPVVLLTSPGATAWCRQARVDPVHHVEDLMDRVKEVTLERRRGTWSSPRRGALVELSDCNVGKARSVLDEVIAGHREQPGLPVRLPPGPTGDVLVAYGIAVHPAGRPGHPGGERCVVLEDQPGVGLTARLGSPLDGSDPGPEALLPLTDRDAEELVEAAPLARHDRASAADLVLRAARLIDDQADVVRIRLPLHAPASGDGPQIWTGRVRGTDDDPFVRRLPSRRPASNQQGLEALTRKESASGR
jgi:GNAT superfamily N-acetyltransferase